MRPAFVVGHAKEDSTMARSNGPVILRQIPEIDCKTGSNRLMAEVIAQGVLTAHNIHEGSWVMSQ